MRETKRTWTRLIAVAVTDGLACVGLPRFLGDNPVAKAVELIATCLEFVLRWLGELYRILSAVSG